MFHLGSFESSLRSSDGGKKYAARKRKDKIALSEVQTKHKSCTGKAHGHGVLKNKGKDAEICCQGKKKRKGEDQCVPKSNESLADSSTGDLVNHKVPGSSQEASIDGSIESDNEKLKSKVCDNCLNTRKTLGDCDRGDNGITSAADVFERWANRIARSRSYESVVCEENMDRKPLKIRGPFGSLVDLSNPSDRNPFANQNRAASPIKSVIVKELPGVEKISVKKSDVTKAKDNQSEDRLFEAIETLSKRKGGDEDKESPDVFEDLDVEEFESERVSKLFEAYFKDVQTKERNETEANIESLLDSLHNLEPSKNGSKLSRNRLRSSLKEKKKNGEVLPERGRLCKTHSKDEDIIKNILPDKKEFLLLNKAKKNAELERKWIPGGILKRSAPASDTVESIRIGAKSPSNQTPTLSVSKNDFLTQKLPVESTVSIKLKISGKSEKPDEKKKSPEKAKKAKKNSEDEFLGNVNGLITNLKKGTVNGSENLQTEKDPKLTKQKFSEIMAENAKRRPSKNEILAKSNEVNRKLQSTASGPSFSPRSSMRRKERINKILEMESTLKDRHNKLSNGVNSDQLNSSLDEDSVDGSKESLKVVKTNVTMNGKLEVNGDPVEKKIHQRLGRPLSEPPTLLERISNLKPMMSKRNSPQDDTSEVLSSRSLRSGKVKKLISNFEMNSHCREDDSEEVKSKARNQSASLGSHKKWEDFKKAKTEEDLANEKAWLDTEKLWLVHRAGFTAVRALPNSSNQPSDVGKVKVKVESTNEVLEVDDDDLEKANPSQLDKIEDICQLRYINESSVLYVLRQRFGNNLIHTYAAGNLIAINPQSTLFIYNEKVAALFRGCKSEDMPPHIYAMAQTAYRSMLSTRKDQSIVLLGRSGSGKTHNFRHILSYLLHSAGSVNKVLDVEKLTALNTVLEAFGNARTCLNPNGTRCTNLISLDFDQTGQISSLLVQILMLEKQRVARRPDGEGTFNVFHWVLAGAEGSLAKQLFLDSTTQNTNLFMNAICKNEDRQRAVMELSKLGLALKILGVSDKECFALWSVIAAIYHLGNAGTVRVGTNKWQFADPVHSSRACRLLGTTSEELCQALWNNASSPSRTPSPTDKDKTVTGVEALEGFVIGLYSELVNVINTLLNRSLTTGAHSSMSLVVVDSPGLQNPGSCGQQRGATFSDLCHNYVQERLHLLFHNVNLVAPHDRYTQEHIDVNTEEIYAELNSPSQLVSILDKSPPSGVLKTSQTDLREIDRRGLLWLLEEESLYPNSNDDTFLERLFQHYGGKDHQMFIKKSGGVGHFVIQHLQGTSPVIYNAHGLLKASKENPVTRSAISFLQESTKEDISELFVKAKGGILGGSGEGSQSLRRVSSIRRTCSVAVKRKSISLQVKFTADSLIETLRRTRPRFVFCMLPHHNAGNTEIIPAGPATGENVLNVPLLRSQIRGAEILPAVRMFKQGFPEYFPYGEFRRRFRLLAPGCGSVPTEQTNPSGVQITINGQPPATEALDEARAVEEMLLHMDVDVTSYRLGLSQVRFFGFLLGLGLGSYLEVEGP